MTAIASVRTRLQAVRVFVLQARIDREIAAAEPSLEEPQLDALLQTQRRSLHGLFRSAEGLPRTSPLRSAAERAFGAGAGALTADPDTEAYALRAHEYELALADLRASVVPKLRRSV